MTRDWILRVLEGLPVWYWPVFLLDVVRVRAWWRALPIEADTMMTLGVDRQGRIHVISLVTGDRAVAAAGMPAVRRKPWLALAPMGSADVPGRSGFRRVIEMRTGRPLLTVAGGPSPAFIDTG